MAVVWLLVAVLGPIAPGTAKVVRAVVAPPLLIAAAPAPREPDLGHDLLSSFIRLPLDRPAIFAFVVAPPGPCAHITCPIRQSRSPPGRLIVDREWPPWNLCGSPAAG